MWVVTITCGIEKFGEREPQFLNLDWIQYLTRLGRDLLIVG